MSTIYSNDIEVILKDGSRHKGTIAAIRYIVDKAIDEKLEKIIKELREAKNE
ncbi:MAG: hypothetical protein GY853_13790 [PVC group bacterium]|nr:hypothetical protein [PVC group bacterium]